jgi:hypothetical protein
VELEKLKSDHTHMLDQAIHLQPFQDQVIHLEDQEVPFTTSQPSLEEVPVQYCCNVFCLPRSSAKRQAKKASSD